MANRLGISKGMMAARDEPQRIEDRNAEDKRNKLRPAFQIGADLF
jgi:hypothetical protein